MAFIHSQSCECVSSELDLFAVPPTQTSIESAGYVEYHPISTLANDASPIEFVVPRGGQDYLDLASTQLYVRAQIQQAGGEALGADDAVGPINLLIQTLFSDVEIKVNDMLITSANNTYAYRAYLETILSYGPSAKTSQLTASMYYKDIAGAMDENNPLAENLANTGLKKRYSIFKTQEHVEMLGRIHADLFFQERYLPSGCGLRLKFIRNKDSFCLLSSKPDKKYKIKIHVCKLLIRKAKITPSVFTAHAKALEVGNMKYPIRRVVVKSFTIPANNLNFTNKNVFSGQIPSRVVIAMVDNDAFNGSYLKNPFNFKHYNLTYLTLLLDGQQGHYIIPMEPNYGAHKYLTAYNTLFHGSGKLYKDEGLDIERDDLLQT